MCRTPSSRDKGFKPGRLRLMSGYFQPKRGPDTFCRSLRDQQSVSCVHAYDVFPFLVLLVGTAARRESSTSVSTDITRAKCKRAWVAYAQHNGAQGAVSRIDISSPGRERHTTVTIYTAHTLDYSPVSHNLGRRSNFYVAASSSDFCPCVHVKNHPSRRRCYQRFRAFGAIT